MKRFLDILLALLVLPIVIPMLLIFGVILLFVLKEWPLFVQERGITLTKYRFRIYKLKTLKNSLSTENIKRSSRNIALKPDLKFFVPKFAEFLRRTGLDELPQIFNILKGDMSFIGPRPLMLSDLEVMKKDYPGYYKMRNELNSKPGLSGLWQIFCNREEGVQNLLTLDTIYDEMGSLSLDFKLMIFTLATVLTGSNADAILEDNLLSLSNLLGFNNSTKFQLNDKLQKVKANSGKNRISHYSVILPGEWRTKKKSVNSMKSESLKIIPINKKFPKSA